MMHPAVVVIGAAIATLFVCMLGACLSPRLSDRFISGMFASFIIVLAACLAWIYWPGAAT